MGWGASPYKVYEKPSAKMMTVFFQMIDLSPSPVHGVKTVDSDHDLVETITELNLQSLCRLENNFVFGGKGSALV